MKPKFLTLLFAILFANVTTSAQLIAGDTAIGQVISNPNINLSVATMNQTKYALIDLDCDSIADMRIELYKGPTMIDGANYATLWVLNPIFEVCADTSYVFGVSPIKYYNLGDTLICTGNNDWLNDTIYNLGNYGCMDCPGPTNINNAFISYKNTLTSQLGWIKISFDLNDGGVITIPITLSISEILSPCTTTELPDPNIASCGIFTFDTIIYPPSCDGFCNGMIDIANLTGGTPPYTYMWSNGDTNSTGFGLCSGNITLIITDSLGNTCSIDLNVPTPLPITFSLMVTNASCYGSCDGSIFVDSLFGGTAPYAFQWDDPLLQTTTTVDSLCQGTYTLCVTDGNGCVTCDTATVLEPAEIQVTENVTNESCLGCCDGAIELFPSGGVGSYSYIFTPLGSVINPVNNLCLGTYNWCVIDAMGCSTCDTVVVSFPTSIDNMDNINVFSIYPNPNNGTFTISHHLIGENYNLEITDLMGKVVHRQLLETKSNVVQINNHQLSNGIYFITVSDKDTREKIVKKLVIQK